eukprot:GHVR01053348.1.p1 GENE.GHVR01053348.1~~GHVR01053348.1.p1  ORF type:complete len:188 (+),score=52.32 GHVR01053348.1:475-1038(+)
MMFSLSLLLICNCDSSSTQLIAQLQALKASGIDTTGCRHSHTHTDYVQPVERQNTRTHTQTEKAGADTSDVLVHFTATHHIEEAALLLKIVGAHALWRACHSHPFKSDEQIVEKAASVARLEEKAIEETFQTAGKIDMPPQLHTQSHTNTNIVRETETDERVGVCVSGGEIGGGGDGADKKNKKILQ